MKIFKFLCSLIIISFITNVMIAQQMVAPMPAGFPEISMEELQEIEKFINSLSEEEKQALEELGRQVLTEMGINPDTLEPIPGAPQLPMPQPALPPVTPPQPEEVPTVETPRPEISGQTRQEIKDLLHSLINHLESLRLKMRTESSFKRWAQEIDELLYFLKVINKPRHHERLAETSSTNLLQQLKILNAIISTQEPAIVVRQVQRSADDPYEILGVSSTATGEEIQEAFDQLAAVRNPEVVRKERQAEGLSDKDIERAVKDARLSFEIIEDAYEKLIDPKTRADVDHEHEASHSFYKEAEQNSQRAFAQISQALSSAIYTNNLFESFEKFLQQYAPEELAQKKALEAAEKQRQQEQAELARRRPTPSPGGTLEPRIRFGEAAPSLPGFFPSAGVTAPTSGALPTADQKGLPETEKEKGEKAKGEEKKKDDKEKDKDKDKDKDKEKGKDKEEKKKSDTSKVKEQEKAAKEIQEILKQFETVSKDFSRFKEIAQQENNKKLLSDLPAYLFQSAPTPESTMPPAVPEEGKTTPLVQPEEEINNKLNNQLKNFIEESKLEDFYKDLKELNKKLGKKIDARIKPTYNEKWNPLYKEYAKPLTDLTAAVHYIQPDKKISEKKLIEHVGTPDQPQPLGTLYALLSKTTKAMEKINKALNPEQYKQDDATAPKQPKSR